MNPIERYFSRNGIRMRELLYIIRENGRTVLYLTDGRRLYTCRTVKEFAALLCPDHFLSVNKGVLVRRDAIAQEKDGMLILTDGTNLRLRRTQRTASIGETKECYLARLCRRYALFDHHPAPHLLFSLPLFDGEDGAVLRYQNHAAERLADDERDALATTALAVLNDGIPKETEHAFLYAPEDAYCLAALKFPIK